MRIHKLADVAFFWEITSCGRMPGWGRSGAWSPVKTTTRWKRVTCKHCLRHKKK